MKTLLRSLSLAFLVLLVLSSCEKKIETSQKGKLAVSLNITDDQGLLKSALTDSVIRPDSGITDTTALLSWHLLVSVENQRGYPVLTDELIPMYQFGPGFLSEEVELEPGEYRLTKFMVLDPAGKVIYASPIAGSPLAYLVNRPLPLPFLINPEAVTRIAPEVLPVLNNPPDQFGYVAFGIQVIRPLVFFTACILDNPMIMAPTQLTDAILTIYANNNWRYSFKLMPAVNRIIIRGGSEMYTFVLEKPGYPPQKLQFYARQLMSTSQENPLILKIPGIGAYNTLVLQPGPEIGKDAMVSNLDPDKNFGFHKYFEATFLSEPVLTVMRSNRSMIWFDMNAVPKSATIRKVVLTLYYDVPIPWDTTIRRMSSEIAWYGGVLQQIIEPWRETEVTWNTQPKTIETNQVMISPFIKNANFIDVDVTKLYVSPANTEMYTPNYGMLFKLWPSEQFQGFRFTSSDYTVAAMRPKLTIFYSLPVVY